MRKTQSKVKGEQEGMTEEERNQDRKVWKSLIQIFIYIHIYILYKSKLERISILVVNLRGRGRYHSTQIKRCHRHFVFCTVFSLCFLDYGEQLPFQRNDQLE